MPDYTSPQANEKRLKRFSTAIFFSSFTRRDAADDAWPARHAGMSAQGLSRERSREAWNPLRPDNHRGGAR